MTKSQTTESFKWGVAVLASLLIHATLLWQQNTMLYSSDGRQLKQSGVTRLSFRTLPTPKQEIPQAPPEPKKVIPEKKPEPPPEPVRKVKKKKPIKQPKAKPVVETKTVKEPTPETVASTLSTPTAGDPVINEQARNNYLGSLAAHIESYKFYPRAARRRGVQGVIKVSFRLLENGSITDLEIDNGHKLLRNAAEKALQRAQPLPKPPTEMDIPLQVNYGMEYRLR